MVRFKATGLEVPDLLLELPDQLEHLVMALHTGPRKDHLGSHTHHEYGFVSGVSSVARWGIDLELIFSFLGVLLSFALFDPLLIQIHLSSSASPL